MTTTPNQNISLSADDLAPNSIGAALLFALQRIAALEAVQTPVITNQEIWPNSVATNNSADPWDL